MAWSWQEEYNAALSEKNPEKLAEQLVAAEKAILRRLQELPHATDEVPEAEALRQALDALYALNPQEHHAPGEFRDEDIGNSRRNWTRLALAAALLFFLSSAARWIIASRNAENRRFQASADTSALTHSLTADIVRPVDHPPPSEADSPESAITARRREDAVDPRLAHGDTDLRPASRATRASQETTTQNTESSDRKVIQAQDSGASVGRETSAEASPAIAATSVSPEESAASPPPAASPNHASESPTTNPTTAPAEPNETLSSSGNEARQRSPLPEGSVSVSTGTYPSIRIPPELSSEATLSAASLQIGTPVSRPDPVYPEEAERQGVQGIAKLRVLIAKDGSVQDVQVLSGPPLLTSASVNALRQWRYKQTFLGDQPVEVSEEVTIVFRLASPTAN